MKFKSLCFLLFLLISLRSFSQDTTPVNVRYAVSKTSYKAGDTLEFIINIQIADGWDLYSCEFPADGPIKFGCTVEASTEYVAAGVIRAYRPFTHYDEVWEGNVKLFENSAQFRVPIIVMKPGKINFRATLQGQVCKDECIALKEKVDLDLSSLSFSDYVAAERSVYQHYGSEGVEKKQKAGRKTKHNRK